MSKTKILYEKERLNSFCESRGIVKLSLFGSVLNEKFNNNSDIDILVDFTYESTPDLIQYAKIIDELSEIFDGRSINLVTAYSLKGPLGEEIRQSAEVQYDSAA